MATKLDELMNETIIYKTFIFFLKTVLALYQKHPRIWKAFLFLFFFPHFTTLTIVMNSFLKFFARVKNNKRLQAPRERTIENRANTCVDKNGIVTGESEDIIFLILLPFCIQLYFIS